MVGAADPMMSFPVSTTFTPYSVVRNTSDASFTLTPTVWWMAGGVAKSTKLPSMSLAPGESENLDVMALLTNTELQNYNGNIDLIFDTQGKRGSLLAAAGSVDKRNTYVFEVNPHGISESASKALAYWSTGNGDDTMVTFWNAADEAQDLFFTLSYAGGHYTLPLHLGPRATQTLVLSDIVDSHTPDADGNVIPDTIHEGSARLSGVHAENEHILVAMDAGVYNVKKATCGLVCFTCDGWESSSVTPSPFETTVNGTVGLENTDTWDTGMTYNLNGETEWISQNANATVSSSGVVTGVSAGSASIYAQDSYESVYTSICVPLPADNPCPVEFGEGAGANGTINDPTPVVTSVSPNPWVAGQTNATFTITGHGFGTAPTLTVTGPSGPVALAGITGSDKKITGTYNVSASSASGPATIAVTSTGYGNGFQCGSGCTSTPTDDNSNLLTIKAMTTLSGFGIAVNTSSPSGTTNSVVSQVSSQVTVTAQSSAGGTLSIYRGSVSFSSTDTHATLPPSYTFTASDNGSHTFTVTLSTVNGTSSTRDLSVTDSSSSIKGTNNIYVWFKVIGTDEGDVGQTTAYGHVIVANDHFVALPSTGLNSVPVMLVNGSTQTNTTVLDVGPWCPHSAATQSNSCVCSNDPYWTTSGTPWAVNNSCSGNHAGVDLADGTFAALGLKGNGSIYWRFQ